MKQFLCCLQRFKLCFYIFFVFPSFPFDALHIIMNVIIGIMLLISNFIDARNNMCLRNYEPSDRV